MIQAPVVSVMKRKRLYRVLRLRLGAECFDLTYNPHGFGYETVLVNGTVVAREMSFWWYVPRFRFMIGEHTATLEVEVGALFSLKAMRLWLDGQLVYNENKTTRPAADDSTTVQARNSPTNIGAASQMRLGTLLALAGATMGSVYGYALQSLAEPLRPSGAMMMNPAAIVSAGQAVMNEMESEPLLIACGCCGLVLLFAGCALLAKAKGRHPAHCLLGLLSFIGVIVLLLLPSKRRVPLAVIGRS